jgi:iron complex outermembrane receptor protein
MRLGLGARRSDVYDVKEARNYVADPVTGLPQSPLPDVQSLPTDQRYSKDATRDIFFAYVQDEWRFLPDWSLTAGLRFDHYSDVENTVNPHAVLVWTTTQKLTTKLLAGRGFRAPTMFELNGQNNPAALGNPELKPVLITNYELNLDYLFSSRLSAQVSFFYHKLDDVINYVPISATARQALNDDTSRGKGVEVSATWTPSKSFKLFGYIAYQENEASDGEDHSLVPRSIYYLRGDWRFSNKWRINPIARYYQNRVRQAGDTRPDLDDEFYLDMVLWYKLTENSDIRLGVFNVFDEQGYAPEEVGIPDVETPGRNALLTIDYKF